jgi:flagellar biosynthesis chaperone FliJ
MNRTRQKFTRVQRLRDLEQSKLDLLAVELSELQSQLLKQRQCLSTLQTQMDNLSVTGGVHAIADLYQTKIWCEHLQTQVTALHQEIDAAAAKRDQLILSVVDQRATVRGWESLLAQLSDKFTEETEKLGSLQVDDRFLNSHVARQR